MTHDKAIRAQAEKNVARVRGSYDAPGFEACVNAEIERLKADHFRDATKKVQNTDSVEGITPFDDRIASIKKEFAVEFSEALESLVDDMQAHIRHLTADLSAERNNLASADIAKREVGYKLMNHLKRKNALLLEAADKMEKEIAEQYAKWSFDYKESMKIVNRIREEADR
jgi:hypothetical protein